MGIIKNILGNTEFYKSYQKKKEKKYLIEKENYELRLLPLKIKFYRKFINKSDLVFDVGANVGNRIEPFLNIGANVIAVEPQPSCIQFLQNKYGDKIVLENVGLGDRKGQLDLMIASDSTISTFSREFIDKTQKTRFKGYEWNESIKVPIVTLESLIEKYGIPQFCKIDVEGFELHVLKGLKTSIPYISFEYCVPEMLQQLIDCLDRLNQISPKATFNFSIGETMELFFGKWKSYEEFVEYVKSDNFSKSSFGDIYFRSK